MARTATARRARPTTKKKSVHIFWIDISDLYWGYAIWKEAAPRARGRKTPPPILCLGQVNDHVDCPNVNDPEFTFTAEELEKAFAELAARKKSPKTRRNAYGRRDGDLPYGEPVPIGSTGIELSREDRHEYVAAAPCGESADFRAGQLRALISAVRELEVSEVAL